MDVTVYSNAPTRTQAAASPSGPKITSDFNTFLKMLTVQMQNQDPLNPIDSTDYAVQLATFSGVEQQVRTNQLLAEMQARFAQMGMADMAGWIGKEARSDADVVYSGRPVTLSPNPAVGSTSVILAIRNAQGTLVSREEIPVSAEPYQWLGADATGAPLPPGRYAITQESLIDGDVVDSRPIEHYSRVVEARGGPRGTSLVLQGGIEVPATRITALREPG